MSNPIPHIPFMRVLIVEDEMIVAMDMEHKIKQMGCEVVDKVVSGELAVKRALELRPDLVLMDIQLKGSIDGIAAARQIRQHADIPVVFLSAFLTQETIEQEGAPLSAAMLAKPFDPYGLRDVLLSISERSKTPTPDGFPTSRNSPGAQCQEVPSKLPKTG